MAKLINLKKYFVSVMFYPKIEGLYDDTFYVWAYDKNYAEILIREYYGNLGHIDIIADIYIRKCVFTTWWYKLVNKVPNKPICEHN